MILVNGGKWSPCNRHCGHGVRDITKLRGYPRSNVKTRLEQSNLFLASGRFPLQNYTSGQYFISIIYINNILYIIHYISSRKL